MFFYALLRRNVEILSHTPTFIVEPEKSANMQLLNSKIFSDSKNTRYSNKKAQDTWVTCAFFVCCRFSYNKDGASRRLVASNASVIAIATRVRVNRVSER